MPIHFLSINVLMDMDFMLVFFLTISDILK